MCECVTKNGYMYSGAVFDTYPADPASGIAGPVGTTSVITDSNLVALSLLGIHVTGYEALIITQYRSKEIKRLLGSISAHARIDDEQAPRCPLAAGRHGRCGSCYTRSRAGQKEARFGAVAAGKLLARKRSGLIPAEDSRPRLLSRHRPRPPLRGQIPPKPCIKDLPM